MTARANIVAAIVARLQGILVSGGYASDAGQSVFEWFPENLTAPPSPCILVVDMDEAITPVGGWQTEHTLAVTIEGQVAYAPEVDEQGEPDQDEDTIGDVRAILGDIVRAIMVPSDRTLGGVCDSIQPTSGGTIKLEQRAEDTVASCVLTFEVRYRTERGDWSVKI